MQDAARVQCAIEILDLYNSKLGPLLSFIRQSMGLRRYAGSKDRRAVTSIILGAARFYDYLKGIMGKQANARACVMAYLVYDEELVIEEIFTGQKHGPSPLEDHEISFLNQLRNKKISKIDMVPGWLVEKLKAQMPLPFSWEQYLEVKAVHLCVNTTRIKLDDFSQELGQGVDLEELDYSPLGLSVRGRENIQDHPCIKQGKGIIQNQGSQIVSLLVDPQPKERILDLCAGAGGKAITLGFICPQAKLELYDSSPQRLKRAEIRLQNAGIIAELHEDWSQISLGAFDKVLVDAPCSGTGTLSRCAEFSFNFEEDDLGALQKLQLDLLEQALRFVRVGGEIHYATCSILKEENEDVVAAFRKK